MSCPTQASALALVQKICGLVESTVGGVGPPGELPDMGGCAFGVSGQVMLSGA